MAQIQGGKEEEEDVSKGGKPMQAENAIKKRETQRILARAQERWKD
jgi:hypothetical protein